jgi:hypothetical protein
MIVVKRQTNGNDHSVLKTQASIEDVQIEAQRLKQLGYEITSGKQSGTWDISHPSFRGKFLLALERDDSSAD